MSAPIVLPPGAPGSRTVIRLAALRDGDAVTVILRSDNSGFGIEHCRAVFSSSQGPAAPGPAGDDVAGRTGASAEVSELYGTVLFQAGRFRRLAAVRLDDQAGAHGSSASRAGIGLADCTVNLPWFGAGKQVSQPLVLGDAGISDAAIQLVQACGPHRRLVFAGCDEVAFAGHEPDGPVTISAVARQQAGQVPKPRPAEGRWAGENDEAIWDVDASDSSGRLLITWKGLRMRDAGPQPQRVRSSEPELLVNHPAADPALVGAATASWPSARPGLVGASISASR